MYGAATCVGLVVALGLYLVVQLSVGNFHEVLPGELYRSAQLGEGDISRYNRDYGIKTVLNLRGENRGSAWYDTEVREAKAAGVTHIDFRMSAGRELPTEQAIALIQIMKDAPKPLLIHCRSGADRTGLAAAFYMAGIAKKGEWAAERQLWIYYGHLPLHFNESFAMNRTFERLEPYLGFPDS